MSLQHVRGPKRPRNPGQVSMVTQKPWHDSFVVSMVHGDGPNNSTTILDDKGHTWTPFGDAKISTAQSVFGGSSLAFDGTGDYILGDGSSDFAFGSGDFTIDFRFRLNVTGPPNMLYDGRNSGAAMVVPVIYVINNPSPFLYVYRPGVGNIITGTTVIAPNTWYHVELARGGTNLKIFLNGVQNGLTYVDNGVYTNPASRPAIGADMSGAGASYVNGYIDELRVSKGIARHVADFTPPTEQYPKA